MKIDLGSLLALGTSASATAEGRPVGVVARGLAAAGRHAATPGATAFSAMLAALAPASTAATPTAMPVANAKLVTSDTAAPTTLPGERQSPDGARQDAAPAPAGRASTLAAALAARLTSSGPAPRASGQADPAKAPQV